MTHTFTRNPELVKKSLVEQSDGSVVTKTGCKIYIPERFQDRFLAEIGNYTKVIGLFAIVVGDKDYSVCNVNSMVEIKPSSINRTKFNQEDYIEFVFDPGSIVIATLDLVQQDVLLYRIYDELFSKGNVPWYINYEDLGNIFDTAKEFAGSHIGKNPEVTQLLVSLISRDPTNREKYYRTVVESFKDLNDKPPAFIPLKSVSYAATNTTNKLAGSYFSVGVVSALVSPSDRVERIEEILRT